MEWVAAQEGLFFAKWTGKRKPICVWREEHKAGQQRGLLRSQDPLGPTVQVPGSWWHVGSLTNALPSADTMRSVSVSGTWQVSASAGRGPPAT